MYSSSGEAYRIPGELVSKHPVVLISCGGGYTAEEMRSSRTILAEAVLLVREVWFYMRRGGSIQGLKDLGEFKKHSSNSRQLGQ